MELSQIFSVLVLAVCTFHAVAVTGNRLSAWGRSYSAKENVMGRVLAAALRLAIPRPSTEPKQRSDWYAFFHCADLTGSVIDPSSSHRRDEDRKTPPAKSADTRKPTGGARLTLS